MKQNSFILALMAAFLVFSCAKMEQPDVEVLPSSEQQSIAFDSYFNQEVTKSSSSGVVRGQVGMFAFYQPGVNGVQASFTSKRYTTPDFMYNQLVDSETGGYEPVKYWPNNAKDLVSFFAYYPYQSNKTWEDLGIYVDDYGYYSAPFVIQKDPRYQTDWMWADPKLNCYNENVGTGTRESGEIVRVASSSGSGANGYGVGDKLRFTFEHALSQISFDHEVIINEGDNQSNSPAKERSGGISYNLHVNSISIKNVYEKVTLSNYAAVAKSMVYSDKSYNGTGSQDITVDDEWYSSDSSPAEMKQASIRRSNYLYLAPQNFMDKAATVVINYTVTVTDDTNPANSSTITNEVSRSLYRDGGLEAFLPGHSYRLKFRIGLTSVNFGIEMVDWTYVDQTQIDVPKNEPGCLCFTNIGNGWDTDVELYKEKNYSEGDEPEITPLEYSKDGENWFDYTAETKGGSQQVAQECMGSVTLKEGEKVYIRAKENTGWDKKPMGIVYLTGQGIELNHYYFSISGAPVKASGNIISLLSKDRNEYNLPEGAFAGLFSGCTRLVQADELILPTNLSSKCFFGMFAGCENLRTVPVLSATTLWDRCYALMFVNCKRLERVPSLPAKRLARGCYQNMFAGAAIASSVTLPATDLTDAEGCYSGMFSNAEFEWDGFVPALPATKLSTGCYSRMFAGSNIVSAPELPAEVMASYCYNAMFNGCVNLRAVMMGATDYSANSDDWNAIWEMLAGAGSADSDCKLYVPSSVLSIWNTMSEEARTEILGSNFTVSVSGNVE